MSDMGIGANVIGAAVIGGETVYVDPNVPNFDHAYTIPVPSQTAEGTLPVVGASDQALLVTPTSTATALVDCQAAQVVAVPVQTATGVVHVSMESDLALSVPDQLAEVTTAFYVVAEQSIGVPSQSAVGDVPNNGRSDLSSGYVIQARPIIGAFSIGDEGGAGTERLASAMAFVAQSATADNPVAAAHSTAIAVPTLDANLRPIVAASHAATLLVDSSSGSGDVDVAALAAVNVALSGQTATGTIVVAGSAGNQQVPSATNAATAAVHVGAVASHTVAGVTITTTGGPVVDVQSTTLVELAVVVNIASQTAEGDVDVSINTLQDGATNAGLSLVNTTASDVDIVAQVDHVAPTATNTVLGGPVVQAAHSSAIDIPALVATATVFFNFQAAQTIEPPAQTSTGDVDVSASSSTTITLVSTGTGDVDFTLQAAQVIDLASWSARAQIHKPTSRFRARRYGGTSYPSPTESGYLDWLSQWAS